MTDYVNVGLPLSGEAGALGVQGVGVQGSPVVVGRVGYRDTAHPVHARDGEGESLVRGRLGHPALWARRDRLAGRDKWNSWLASRATYRNFPSLADAKASLSTNQQPALAATPAALIALLPTRSCKAGLGQGRLPRGGQQSRRMTPQGLWRPPRCSIWAGRSACRLVSLFSFPDLFYLLIGEVLGFMPEGHAEVELRRQPPTNLAPSRPQTLNVRRLPLGRIALSRRSSKTRHALSLPAIFLRSPSLSPSSVQSTGRRRRVHHKEESASAHKRGSRRRVAHRDPLRDPLRGPRTACC